MHPFYTDDPDKSTRHRAQSLLRLHAAVTDIHGRRTNASRRRTTKPKVAKVLPRLEEFDPNPLTAAGLATHDPTQTGYRYSQDDGPRVAQKGRARFWEVIGPQPRCAGGERWRAKLYHDAILRAMDAEEWLTWRRAEREQLRQLELRWRRRASGEDVRFNVVGNKAGTLPPEEREAVRRARLERVGHP